VDAVLPVLEVVELSGAEDDRPLRFGRESGLSPKVSLSSLSLFSLFSFSLGERQHCLRALGQSAPIKAGNIPGWQNLDLAVESAVQGWG
jgi:hypothetical protein